MRKIFLAVLIVLLVLGVTAFVRLSVPDNVEVSQDKLSGDVISDELLSSISLPSVPSDLKGNNISVQQLSAHNKKSDCWVGYDGKVYDITSFLPRHPGSAGAISPYCGTSDDFTQAFTSQHGTKKVSMLMKVGTLVGDFDIIGRV